MNRHIATTSMARGFLAHCEPPHSNRVLRFERAGNLHGMGIVALWRIETEGRGLNPQGPFQSALCTAGTAPALMLRDFFRRVFPAL